MDIYPLARIAACIVALTSAPIGWFEGQVLIRFSVFSRPTRTAIAGAVVSAGPSTFTRTDRLGRAWMRVRALPVTVVVTQIGFAPDALTVHEAGEIEVLLTPRPVDLAALTVTAVAEGGLMPSVTSGWRLPADIVRDVPLSAQTDPVRALILVPSASFSSPLSGRPLLRGYDASHGAMRLDGFEIVNPYHIGRIFSTFPADAIEAVAVRPAPTGIGDGETLSGTVEFDGRQAVGPGPGGGADLGLAAISAWGGTGGARGAFLAGRAAYLQGITDLIGEPVRYAFQDVYARAQLLGGRRTWELSAFGAHDDYGERAAGNGMEWTNLLVGNRWRLMDRPGRSLDLTLMANRFRLSGDTVTDGHRTLNLRNRFARGALGASGSWSLGAVKVGLSGGVGRRSTSSEVEIIGGREGAPPPDPDTVPVSEAFGALELETVRGPLVIRMGGRVDAAGRTAIWQPRAAIEYRPKSSVALGILFASAGRLYHVISDPSPEPTVTFVDLWLNAGRDGVPVPRVDHVALHLGVAGRQWSLTADAFGSRGRGLGELRPAWDDAPGALAVRFGDSRTVGLETRVAWRSRSRTPSVALTYVLSRSERRWDRENWRPWRLDRRHDLRVHAGLAAGTHWRFFAAGQLLSGQPLTPVAEVVWAEAPPLGVDSAGSWPRLTYRYAAEGSARSAATFHFDIGARWSFDGPGRSVMAVGLSVINVTLGPVAPSEPIPPGELFGPEGYDTSQGVPTRRRFTLPPVPALSISIRF